MSRNYWQCGLMCVALPVLSGCATSEQRSVGENVRPAVSTVRWNKYYVAGSRIPREVDANGQPLTGSHIVTITDEQLQRSSGVLLGEKLSGGYPR